MNSYLLELSEKYPFLTIISHGTNEYTGIVQNSSKMIVSIYVYDKIIQEDYKRLFLKLGQEWWWSSNRSIPINIFLKGEFDIFHPYLYSFNAKEVKLVHGPMVSLGNIAKKRIKRRKISLVKNLDKNKKS